MPSDSKHDSSSDSKHVRTAAETVGEEQDAGVTAGRDRQGAEGAPEYRL